MKLIKHDSLKKCGCVCGCHKLVGNCIMWDDVMWGDVMWGDVMDR